MKKYLVVICFLFFGLSGGNVYASQKNTSFSMNKISKQLQQGKVKESVIYVAKKLRNLLMNHIVTNKDFLKEILFICFIAAIFQNFSDAFFQNSSSDVAFYVTYLTLVACMTKSFMFMLDITEQAMININQNMKGILTAYCLSVVSVSGVSSSVGIYELYVGVLYLISNGLKFCFIPGIKAFFLSCIINCLTRDGKISKLCEAIEWCISLSLKVIMGGVLGLQLIQSMILPHVDAMKNGLLLKGISMIPGVGSGAHTVTKTLIGSAVVIKNSIGAAGIFFLLFLLAGPLIQLGAIFLSYFCSSIIMQPISDERVIGVLDGMVRSIKLCMKSLLFISVLFMISIAMIAFSTNVTYYAE